ncbi:MULTISPECIES: hypothetical protein [unclassified Novosphingobium]|uniref:hypothetical protein n=1 Tax=unclassified Novosphingobium TaxID=2644732 RepID=UPI0025E0AEAF|nr:MULTISPECIES: hypothetical protein [unclassified Novosphingobium]HQS68792.1 hypothetical protein [Novosphingobium sp.]
MNLSFIDWIWRIKGRIEVNPTEAPPQAFEKLEELFQKHNTTYQIDGDTLTFTKNNPLPQDKMSIFDRGTLVISNGKLFYDMTSRALLACFLAPLFFYGLGHAGVAIDKWRNPPEVVKAKAEAAKKRQLVKPEDVPMNPVDELLGAPVPEKKKDGEQIGKRNRKPSMQTAYIYMGIFFALWIVGRILEHKLIHNRFRKMLYGEAFARDADTRADAGGQMGNTIQLTG